MSNIPSETIIDLTNSFSLVNHALAFAADAIIELDDSLDVTNPVLENVESPVANLRHRIQENVIDLSEIPVTPTVAEPNVPARRRRKNSKNGKNKVKPSEQMHTTTEEHLRERSPLRNDFRDCPICYERLGVNPLVSTKCGHVFCEKCLLSAIRSVKKCPTCRRSLRGNSAFHPLYLN